ncbi:hypothetical protein GCM10008927_29530 [Amylibacter ulvae]|uniref:Uncharacterized protein n=1 Tax=Paramylibacter ulvae TaxID=1651968 RepID=A0ABQ3D8T7_9RHOB|nr:hypothetical protein GCM10008927_29530 [Amylibacter ulvae]
MWHTDRDPQSSEQKHRKGHKSKPAKLDEHSNDRLTKSGKGGPSIDKSKPSNCHRRGRGEQSFAQTYVTVMRDWQPEQYSPQNDERHVE